MPSDEENVQYLYLVLTHGGAPTIDWEAVGAAMDLKKGAVSKRWSRLKTSMEKGESPGGSVYNFLWLCLKHSNRDKAMNWTEIAEKCNTTAGAASKRYSRMKQAFDAGAAPSSNPGSPAPKTPAKTSTPRKKKGAATDGEEGQATPTPKRKRASPKKKQVEDAEDDDEEIKFKSEPKDESAEEDEETKTPSKKTKVAKAKAPPKPRSRAKAAAAVKNEVEDEVEDEVMDSIEDQPINVAEWVQDLVGGDDAVNDWLNESV